jgi:predicted nucleic acid-binding protein
VIVVDSSALVNALVEEPADPHLLALLSDEELHAPALLDFEVASALRGHRLSGRLRKSRMEEAADDFAALQLVRYQMTHWLRHLLELKDNFTVYDAAYVVLSQALGAPLVTADAKLTEARRLGVEVRVFGPSDPQGMRP